MGQAPLSVWRSWMVRLPPKYFASERKIIDLAEDKNPTVKGVLRSPARWLETRDSRCVATRQSASCRNTYGTSSAERAAIVGGPPAALCTPRAKYYVVLYSLISSVATTFNGQCYMCLRTSAAANAHCMRAAVVGLVGSGARMSDALRQGVALDVYRPS